MLTAWRIYKPKHSADAFSGEGARRYGGRWNSPGISVVYVAGSQALAALELLVHLSSAEILAAYEMRGVSFDDQLVETVAFDELNDDWRSDPAPMGVRALGDAWVREARTAVLRVPSTVVPDEPNYLLNPAHQDFARVILGAKTRFAFDPRLSR